MNYTYNPDGSLSTAGNNAGTYSFTYDDLGRVATITYPNGITLNYGYDGSNNVTSITDNQGGVVASTFDTADQLTGRALTGTGVSSPLSALFTLDADGNVTQTRRYNDSGYMSLVSQTNYGFDDDGNMTSEVHKDASGVTLVSYSYTYNSLDEIMTYVRTDAGGTTTTPYSYDSVGEVTGAGNSTYSYDPNGNRDLSGYTVGANNQITSDGTWTYTYDSVGNVIEMSQGANATTWFFTYNLNNQMLSAEEHSDATTNASTLIQRVDYVYDVFGDMIARTVTAGGVSTTTKYAYDVSGASIGIDAHVNPLWAEMDDSGTITERYLDDANGTILARSGSDTNGTAWLLTDYQGSTTEVLDSSGALQDAIAYDAYGNITSQTNSDWTGDYTFQGLRLDSATDQLQAKYRFMLPDGQWSAQDQTGFAAGDSNLRREMGNRPTIFVDSSGLDKWYYDPKNTNANSSFREKEAKPLRGLPNPFGAAPDPVNQGIKLSIDMANDPELGKPLLGSVASSWEDVLQQVKAKTSNGKNLISRLSIGGHGMEGSLFGQKNETEIPETRLNILDIEAFKKGSRSKDSVRAGEVLDILKKIKQYMTPNGKIELVSCNSFGGPQGKRLRSELEDIFRSGMVIGYDQPVHWDWDGAVTKKVLSTDILQQGKIASPAR